MYWEKSHKYDFLDFFVQVTALLDGGNYFEIFVSFNFPFIIFYTDRYDSTDLGIENLGSAA